jgi:hypothetical protein
MTIETSTIEQADPLKSVADAMKDAVNQATEDATCAKERISQRETGKIYVTYEETS